MKTVPDRVWVIVRHNPAKNDRVEYFEPEEHGWTPLIEYTVVYADPQLVGLALRQARKSDPGAYAIGYVLDPTKIKVEDM